MEVDFAGVKIGHATSEEHHTGCTVFLCPPGTYASVEARGPAPGSREFALLAPDKPEDKPVNAIVLTGGSAFGLASADGVMRYLAERGIGYMTPITPVPIVPAAVVFDLGLGQGAYLPDAELGRLACEAAAADEPVGQGNVGAGAGVLVGTWAGFENLMKGGFGMAGIVEGEVKVAAAAVVNSVGDVVNKDGSVLAGARHPEGGWMADRHPLRYVERAEPPAWGTNTTLVVAATNAKLTRSELSRLSQQAQNGVALAIRPAHTRHDGDTAFALATGQVETDSTLVANMVVEAVGEAIRNGVRHARSVMGIPGLAD